jgi:hypothetical protein
VVVHGAVVVVADQHAVADRGRPALGPVPDVMRPAPTGRTVAAGERAAGVSDVEGAAQRRRRGPGGVPDVEGFAVPAQDDRDDLTVARQSAHRLDAERQPAVQQPGSASRAIDPAATGAAAAGGVVGWLLAQALLEAGERHGDHELDGLTVLGGQFPGAQRELDELDQRVPAALPGAARVRDRVRGGSGFGQRVQCGAQHRGGFLVQVSPRAGGPIRVQAQRELPAGHLVGLVCGQPLAAVGVELVGQARRSHSAPARCRSRRSPPRRSP